MTLQNIITRNSLSVENTHQMQSCFATQDPTLRSESSDNLLESSVKSLHRAGYSQAEPAGQPTDLMFRMHNNEGHLQSQTSQSNLFGN